MSNIKLNKTACTRKKIWELDSHFFCSLLGTCLDLKEAKKILIKAGFSSAVKTMSDFDIHSNIISFLNKKNKVSSMVQKTLDFKYKNDIDTVLILEHIKDLKSYWKENLQKGTIPGAYWAIMTHSSATETFLCNAFGEVHMLSHLNGHTIMADVQKIEHLEYKIQELESEKKNYKKHIRDLNKDKKKILSQNSIIEKQNRIISEYKQKKTVSEDEMTTITRLFDELTLVTHMYKSEKTKNEKLEAESKSLRSKNTDLEKSLHNITLENTKLEEEIINLEKSLTLVNKPFEKICEKGIQNGCGLCNELIDGKTILYVGGKPSAIPHCKALVEKQGGTFIHHDGGIEKKSTLLNQAISRADVVFCPLDCVSHDACNRVKKICKQKQKILKLLRSSGISSLSLELHYSFHPFDGDNINYN